MKTFLFLKQNTDLFAVIVAPHYNKALDILHQEIDNDPKILNDIIFGGTLENRIGSLDGCKYFVNSVKQEE